MKLATAALVPASLVAARFAIPLSREDDLWQFFAVVGFFATLIGCFAAALVLRARTDCLPLAVLVSIAVLVASILLAVFPTMPNWPFTDIGLVVAWLLMACGLSAAAIYIASYRYV